MRSQPRSSCLGDGKDEDFRDTQDEKANEGQMDRPGRSAIRIRGKPSELI